VEYGMLGSMCKYKDTKFDIVVLSKGGDFDESSDESRHSECRSVWENIDNIDGSFLNHNFIKDIDEDNLVNQIESKYKIDDYDCIFIPPKEDSHFEHRKISSVSYALVRRSKCGLINYRTPSTLDNWTPNLFVDLDFRELRDKKDGHPDGTHLLFQAFIWYIKLNKMKLFSSQQDKSYFTEESITSFHSNYQCSSRGMQWVESFKMIRGYN
jgi:LmbE family N-acetylglucosaminyl deacetylase